MVDNLPGRWIEDIGGTAIIGYKLAVNQMLDAAHGKNSKEQHQVRITSRPSCKKYLHKKSACRHDQSIRFNASPTASNIRSRSCAWLLKVGPNCRVSPPKRT
ncbi:hypothetical protein ALO86_101177 [Pseudomonas syringae pv. berberidis]|nr:hypothetical protein ALO86_101177 [Pseudomonas syringae pv. berberidis]RMM28066.1 hypothetical protein ALQ83_101362 [Pseudomonas syringae pv. berberidis]RMP66670.1 hypothetical protein ALQ19_101397 [Pseudomonas syringae pv. berberidis]